MMTRTSLLLALTVCLSGSDLAAGAGHEPRTAPERRPNLLLIITDDQRWDALGAVQREQKEHARFPWFTTPNLDRLGGEGVRFRNAFVVHSLCSPSRASFLSGQYSHRHGITGNKARFGEDCLNQAALLRQVGYRTAYIGKFHMWLQPDRPGFDYVASYRGQGNYEKNAFLVNGAPQTPAGWVDDVATDYALEFMRTNRTDPWMMVLGYKSAHTPRQPPARARLRFANEGVKVAANAGAKPSYGRGQLAYREDLPKPTLATTDASGSDNYLLNYFRCISAVDDNIGRILNELDALKIGADTAVVFAGDNGYFLGEHGLGDKRAAYEESMRIPLLMRYPRLIPRGRVVDELVLNIDLAPTFLDLAGVAVPDGMQGESWRGVITGHAESWRRAFLFEYFFEPPLPATPAIAAVRTQTAKLIEYVGHPNWTELFDLKSDPYETRNLAKSRSHAILLQQMREELAKQKEKFGDPFSTTSSAVY